MRPPPTAPRSRRPGRPGLEPARPLAGGLRLPGAHVQAIAQSHERCVALGVSRIEAPDLSPLPGPDLAITRDRNRRLYDHAAPVMEMLYEQIVQSQSMVVLTDARGVIVHSIGDDDFLERASKVALRPGAVWSETAKGTNAIGTALVEEAPTLVHADEHYVHAHQFLTCSAAPILDPRGNILGVLDVSGDHRGYHQHTMALVKMSARMIENGWLSDDYRNVMRLHFHSRVEFIGTLMEGILAVAADGRIVGANRGALEQLALSGAALRMHSLASLFGTTVDALVDRFRSPLATPAPVHGPAGRPFHLLARFNWPVWTSLAEAVSAAAPVRPAGGDAPALPVPPQRASLPVGAALAQLRSGDARMDTVIEKLRRTIDRDIAVLLLGEAGTGKQTLARALHRDSARGDQPFVALDCAAVPAAQIDSALLGAVARARGGTLFLDGIEALPLPEQAQLLRLLQERQFTPRGGGAAPAADPALVCATTAALRERIAQQAFREDLFHRLNGLAVRLPPLRERSDLAVLVHKLLRRHGGGRSLRLAPEVEALFAKARWPGNLRQLSGVLRTACAMAAAESVLTRQHLPDDLLDDTPTSAPDRAAPVADAPAVQRLDDLQTEAIRRAVASAGGNISRASKQLGISRNTIYRKLRWNQAPE